MIYRNFLLLLLLCFANVYAHEDNLSRLLVKNTVETSAKLSRNADKRCVETGLYYNRFRYYNSETGQYISQDPIGLAGNNPNFYAYVHNSNAQVDVFGLDPIRTYENAPYHGTTDNAVKSKAPLSGQTALDNSVQVKPTSPRRVGVDAVNNQISVLDRTIVNADGSEVYHGHVRSWEDLHVDQQNALKKSKLVDKKGNITCG